MNCLIVGAPPRIEEMYSIIWSKLTGGISHEAINGKHAKDQIERGTVFDFIIIVLPQDDQLSLFLDYLSKSGKQIPILFTADDNNIHQANQLVSYHPLAGRVSFNSSQNILENNIKRLLRIGKRKIMHQDKYIPIRVSFFLKVGDVNYDLYVKLSEEKYVRVYKKHDYLNPEDVVKFQERKVENFYLKSKDYLEATNVIFSKIKAAVEIKKPRVELVTKFAQFASEEVIKSINKLGLTSQTLELADTALGMVQETSRKVTHLKKHLEQIMSGGGRLSQKVMMTCFLCTAIAKELEWYSDTTVEKLTTSALFCDLDLDEKLAFLRDFKSNEFQNLNSVEKDKVLNHPQVAADNLKVISGILPDIDRIILQHHETMDGSGFPRGLDYKRIFSLAVVLIIAEEFAVNVIESGLENAQMAAILDDMVVKYDKGNFSQVVKALCKALGHGNSSVEYSQVIKLSS